MRHFLPVLGLLGFPFSGYAQTAPAINLLPETLQLQAGARPSDVLVRTFISPLPTTPAESPSLLVALSGTNTVCAFTRPSALQTFLLIRIWPLPSGPLSLAPIALDNLTATPAADDFVVLTANGTMYPFLSNSTAQLMYQQGAAVPLRQGLACAPTDRLVVGKYQTGTGFDVACWSNGPQPGIMRAHNLGNGAFQVLPPVPPLRGDSATMMVTAELDVNAQRREGALIPQQADTAGTFRFRPNMNSNAALPGWWPASAVMLSTGPGSGRCVSMTVGDVNNDGIKDIITVGQSVSVRLGVSRSSLGYVPSATINNYPLIAGGLDVLLADLNGDNRPELLALGNDQTLNIFRNISRSGPDLFEAVPVVYATGPDPARLRVGDADGDGRLDVLVPCRGDATVRVYWNPATPLNTANAKAEARLDVYPNPAETTLHLHGELLAGPTQSAQLLDVSGRTVRRWASVTNDTSLSVADLPRGLYLLRVVTSRRTLSRRVLLR